jgi:hypothetical protein
MYAFTTTLTGLSFDEAIVKTTAALNADGFGILSDIDVPHAMKENSGRTCPCRPTAFSALTTRRWRIRPSRRAGHRVAAAVQRDRSPRGARCFVVGFLDPLIMVSLVGKPKVREVADAAESDCAAPA